MTVPFIPISDSPKF